MMKNHRIYNKWYKELWWSFQEWLAPEDEVTTINPEEDNKAFAVGLGFVIAVALFITWLIMKGLK